MTVALSVNGLAVHSFEELVGRLPADAVASPKRSTVLLTDYWREPEPRLRQLWRDIGHQPSGPVELRFEHGVPVRAGKGKASYTDLMVLADNVAVAIEAKFTEPRYESVADWLGPSPTKNRSDVLDGWLGAIADVVGNRLSSAAVAELPYQLIHRTASVCSVARERRYVVYQVFGDKPPAHYAEELGKVAGLLLGGDRLRFILLTCEFDRLEAYRRLAARWKDGHRDLGGEVREALLAGPLLEFRDPVVTAVPALD